MRAKSLLLSALFLWVSPAALISSTLHPKGLLALWSMAGLEKPSNPQLGLRYIPEFSLALRMSGSAVLDTELSAHAFGTVAFNENAPDRTEGEIKPYRLWLRFSLSKFEARLGLQKINFGSASLLRPLMWFDSLDPRDPLQLTDGVYGLLLRYYFVNNTNIWFWGLYGNEKAKGWEAFPTEKKSVEYGGRMQIPLLAGELAFTYHHRRADLEKAIAPDLLPGPQIVPEDRYALDGKWDLGVGLWFEGTLTRQENQLLPTPWQRAVSLGLDYTFGVGNGLYLMGEHFNLTRAQEAFGSGNDANYSAVLARYPLGLLDEITGIFYYDWENAGIYRFLSWQRTYDKWKINAVVFWNPKDFLIYPAASGNNPFRGKGFQVTIVFHY